VTTLQRITTDYSEAEDRIRLTGELPNGDTVTLWLTQRLLNRLIAHLCQWLEQGNVHQHLPHADLLQAFAQQAAQAALTPEAPVRSAQQQGELVHSVDISHTSEVLQMTFKGESGNPLAHMSLQALPLRQWLGIVHAQYQKAQWPMEAWPEWVTEANQDQAAQQGGVGVVWQ
jgi:hypothetical protein